MRESDVTGRRAVVCGSLNVDLFFHVPSIPRSGETALARRTSRSSGGKGANQAIALRRLGLDVSMLGAVGDDEHADIVLDALATEGVSTRFVSRRGDLPTGLAAVAVDAEGENMILVAPGANDSIGLDDADAAGPAFAEADLLLAQLEVPISAVEAAAARARAAGCLVVLNAAPARELSRELLAAVDVLVVNEWEAIAIARSDAPQRAAEQLLAMGPSAVVVTLGAAGCLVLDGDGVDSLPADAVDVVDTTGAGDSFTAALAVGISERWTLREAAAFATAAAGLTVSRSGSQVSIPTRAEVQRAHLFQESRG